MLLLQYALMKLSFFTIGFINNFQFSNVNESIKEVQKKIEFLSSGMDQ